jgi:hypothetical protein
MAGVVFQPAVIHLLVRARVEPVGAFGKHPAKVAADGLAARRIGRGLRGAAARFGHDVPPGCGNRWLLRLYGKNIDPGDPLQAI